ncbi:transaldolase [Methylobrevis pamukkalensis]|uniref:Transaldolase n=1 Tax=Methylobrevis pamukkalensis TaxID=1439726 RepID=A0A1E3H4Q6_9HYPH|nr:transaldolase [Methylobrevis pamukkalensis]ODN71308.1 Transaldolase B [Methylobrevis pamukkalensis]
MTSKLDQLRAMTTVVADTGDIDAIRRLKPVDCTTNPTLVLKALGLTSHAALFDEAVTWGRSQSGTREGVVAAIGDRLAVAVGAELARLVPGRVSTEVDADLSFDTAGSIAKAHEIVAAYDALGIPREKILIKLASTWEGIRAAEVLQGEGIDCNMTLIFSIAQAVACAEAKAFLISPFVGRILDWYVAKEGRSFTAEEDPGVLSVREIYTYYKAHGIETVVMGASFRTAAEIEALAGCDRLTISPALLDELAADEGELPRKLSPEMVTGKPAIYPTDERAFRWAMNENAMATEKLAEGIRGFAKDLRSLRSLIIERLDA